MTREEAIKWYDEEIYLLESAVTLNGINGNSMKDEWNRQAEIHRMAIAALREQPQWISVEERLPEEWVEVLVFVPGVGCEVAWFCGAGNLWRWAWTGESVTLDVTHWMPLPEAPKEEV